jgi:hypothetical protein
VEQVVRRGHLRAVTARELCFADGEVRVPRDTLVVHCAGDGLPRPPVVPIWRPEAITLQTVRAGFPSFCAALIGYVEATRSDDTEKNRLCPPSTYGNTLRDWAEMQVRGARGAASFSAEPDIREWGNGVALNPTRVPAVYGPSPALEDARERLARHTAAGVRRLAQLSHLPA